MIRFKKVVKKLRHLRLPKSKVGRLRIAAAALVVVAVGAGASVLVFGQSSTSTPKKWSQTELRSGSPAKTATDDTTGQTIVPKVPAVSTTTPAAGTLVISSPTLSVKDGKSQPFTIKASNGAKINMPRFTQSTPNFDLNTPASPAKQSWSVVLTAYYLTNSGTYTLNVVAQDNSGTSYYGKLTVTVLDDPLFTATITPYDYSDTTVSFNIHFKAQDGFYEPIQSISASPYSPGVICKIPEPGTAYVSFPESGVTYTCSGLPAHSSGTLSVTIFAGGKWYTASTSYAMP